MNKKIYIGIGIVVVVLIALLAFRGGITGNVVAAEPIDGGDVIKVPVSGVSKNAVWYDYNSNGVNVKYFLVKSGSDIKTAFDACDVCYRSRKGYSQQGGDMVCNNCGNHYPISGLGTANLRGGCWPGYLPSSVEGDYVIIRKADLDTGRYRFA